MGDPNSTAAAVVDRSPNADDRDRLNCPLCGYSLRGLVEPRCPECGYAFNWEALLYAERNRHPYLFEHHSKRNVWSFFKTEAAGLRPGRFWRTLQAAHRPNVRRLMLYWMLAASLTIVAVVALFGQHAVQLARDNAANRRFTIAQFSALIARNDWRAQAGLRQYGSAQAWARAIYPSPVEVAFWPAAARSFVAGQRGQPLPGTGGFRANGTGIAFLVSVGALYAAWPWATFGALMIFQASMHRARVWPVHVLRAAVYACDATWLVVPAAILFAPILADPRVLDFPGIRSSALAAGWASVLFAAFTTWRLAAAYRHYLRFDLPLATVVAAQTIVLLLAFIALLPQV